MTLGESSCAEPSWLDTALWPYPPRWVGPPGARQHYVDIGSGLPLVLVHGTPTWSLDWRHVIEGLRADHRLIALDHLGFGLSERPADAEYTVAAHTQRLSDALHDLLPTGKVVLVVHDFGGPIALPWALAHPERVAGIVIVNSWFWGFADDPKMRKRAAMIRWPLFRWLYGRFNFSQRVIMPSAYADRSKLTAELHRQVLATMPDAASRQMVLYRLALELQDAGEQLQAGWQRRSALAGVPVAVIWGTRDSAFGPENLTKWQEGLPQAHVVALAEAGHWPQEEAPERFVAELRSWLAAAVHATTDP